MKMSKWKYYEKVFSEYFNDSEILDPSKYHPDKVLARLNRNIILFCWNWDFNQIDDYLNIIKNNDDLENINDLKKIIDEALEDFDFNTDYIDSKIDDFKFSALKEIFDEMNIKYDVDDLIEKGTEPLSLEKVPLLIMPIGIPGSGKTTWINKTFKDIIHDSVILNNNKTVAIHPDRVREELTGSISDLSHDKKVWKLVKRRVSRALKQGKDVILDATNVSSYYRCFFIEGLPPCKLQAKLFDISPEEAKKRIRFDIENGVNRSDVPDKVLNRMHSQLKNESSINQLKEEGFEIIN